jgi:hypothetical protein
MWRIQISLLIAPAAPDYVKNFGFVWTCRNAAAAPASGALVAGSSTDAQRRCCGQGAKRPLKLVVQTSNDPAAPPSDPTHPTLHLKIGLFSSHMF